METLSYRLGMAATVAFAVTAVLALVLGLDRDDTIVMG